MNDVTKATVQAGIALAKHHLDSGKLNTTEHLRAQAQLEAYETVAEAMRRDAK